MTYRHVHLVYFFVKTNVENVIRNISKPHWEHQSVKAVVSTISIFPQVLAEFSEITHPPGCPRTIKHNTVHFIKNTDGLPICCRPCHLTLKKIISAKNGFEDMVQSGTARPSKSA